MLQEGLQYTSSTEVSKALTAESMGSGDMQVFATPAMIALMENAAMCAVKDYIGDANATVGAMISTSHIKASAMGETITATATLIKVEGRKLDFKVTAKDSMGVIGEGEHTRFIVDRAKFLAKLTK